MEKKLYDSELKIMEILWEQGDTAAKEIAAALYQQIGWSKTTTYTVIKKCITKGAIERKEPNFICRALISKEEAQEYEINLRFECIKILAHAFYVHFVGITEYILTIIVQVICYRGT